jgi:hypothetical protein
MEVSIDTSVTIRYTADEGKEETGTDRMKLQPDLANGMIFTLLRLCRVFRGDEQSH